MAINERLTTALLVLKIVFWCVLIYTAVIGAMFMRDSRDIIQTRLERGEPPFRLDGILAAMKSGDTEPAYPTGIATTSIRDSEIAASLMKVQDAARTRNQAGLISELTNLDGILAAKGLTEARTTNQALLKAVQAGDTERVNTLVQQLLQQLSK